MSDKLHVKQTVERLLGYSDTDKKFILESLLRNKLTETTQKSEDITLLADFTEEAVELYKSFGKMRGLSSGYKSIDGLTKGFRPGELIILSAKTSVGKTSLAMNIAANIALKGVPVLFVNLEMTHVELAQRYIHITGGISNGDASNDYTTIGTLTVLQRSSTLSWRSIAPLIAKAKKEMKAELVIIDHLHYFSREISNVNDEIGIITKEFKNAAVDNDIPIMLVAHTRKVDGTVDVTSNDIRGSSFIAQDSDIVLMMNRTKDDPYTVKVKVEKNRNAGIDFENDEVFMKNDKTKFIDTSYTVPIPEEVKHW